MVTHIWSTEQIKYIYLQKNFLIYRQHICIFSPSLEFFESDVLGEPHLPNTQPGQDPDLLMVIAILLLILKPELNPGCK